MISQFIVVIRRQQGQKFVNIRYDGPFTDIVVAENYGNLEAAKYRGSYVLVPLTQPNPNSL